MDDTQGVVRCAFYTAAGFLHSSENLKMSSRFRQFIYGDNGVHELLGVDHIQLRRKAGITRGSMCEYLRGVHRPSKATVARIAGALGMSQEYVCSQIDIAEPSRRKAIQRIPAPCRLCGRRCPHCLIDRTQRATTVHPPA